MRTYRYSRTLAIGIVFALLLGACGPGAPGLPADQPQGTEAAPVEEAAATEALTQEVPTEETLTSDPTPSETPTMVPPTDEVLAQAAPTCETTQPDSLGPFYEADAPVRDRVGEGYLLSGSVLSVEDCQGINGAQIEFWLAGPDGEYRDEYRATMFSSDGGGFQFESHFPPPYQGRPSHIHIRVTAPGFQELVTQHYPETGDEQATFNLVLVPSQ